MKKPRHGDTQRQAGSCAVQMESTGFFWRQPRGQQPDTPHTIAADEAKGNRVLLQSQYLLCYLLLAPRHYLARIAGVSGVSMEAVDTRASFVFSHKIKLSRCRAGARSSSAVRGRSAAAGCPINYRFISGNGYKPGKCGAKGSGGALKRGAATGRCWRLSPRTGLPGEGLGSCWGSSFLPNPSPFPAAPGGRRGLHNPVVSCWGEARS